MKWMTEIKEEINERRNKWPEKMKGITWKEMNEEKNEWMKYIYMKWMNTQNEWIPRYTFSA